MQPQPGTERWPLYSIGPQETGVWGSALPVIGLLESAIPADPVLVYEGANYVSLGVLSEGVTVRFRAPPDMSDGDAKERAWELLDQVVPGVFDRAAEMIKTVAAEVVAPTVVDLRDVAEKTATKVEAAAVGVSSAIPWLTVAAVAVAVVFVARAVK